MYRLTNICKLQRSFAWMDYKGDLRDFIHFILQPGDNVVLSNVSYLYVYDEYHLSIVNDSSDWQRITAGSIWLECV